MFTIMSHFGWNILEFEFLSLWNYMKEVKRREREMSMLEEDNFKMLEHVKSFSLTSINVQCIVLPSSYDI